MRTPLKVTIVLLILALMAFVPGICGLGSGTSAAITSSGTADLRGYGQVAWRFSESSAEFTCADGSLAVSPPKAEVSAKRWCPHQPMS